MESNSSQMKERTNDEFKRIEIPNGTMAPLDNSHLMHCNLALKKIIDPNILKELYAPKKRRSTFVWG